MTRIGTLCFRLLLSKGKHRLLPSRHNLWRPVEILVNKMLVLHILFINDCSSRGKPYECTWRMSLVVISCWGGSYRDECFQFCFQSVPVACCVIISRGQSLKYIYFIYLFLVYTLYFLMSWIRFFFQSHVVCKIFLYGIQRSHKHLQSHESRTRAFLK